MVGRDGRVIWVHDETFPLLDEAGRERVWLGVMFDVTERKRAEQDLERALLLEQDASEQLRRADDIKNTFLQAVSHDLRSPLTAVLGSALTLEREDELGLPPEDRRDLLHGIVGKTKKLVAIVSDLLDMERLSGGHLEPNRSTEDVGKLVARVVAESDVLAGRPVHVDTEPVRLPVDTLMVERIVENLLANAAKHTPADTTVWVRVRSRPDGAVISVEDNGPGIAADRHDQIFAAFERGAEGSTNVPGVGLGLSLVLRFAELHGGRAWLEDRSAAGRRSGSSCLQATRASSVHRRIDRHQPEQVERRTLSPQHRIPTTATAPRRTRPPGAPVPPSRSPPPSRLRAARVPIPNTRRRRERVGSRASVSGPDLGREEPDGVERDESRPRSGLRSPRPPPRRSGSTGPPTKSDSSDGTNEPNCGIASATVTSAWSFSMTPTAPSSS